MLATPRYSVPVPTKQRWAGTVGGGSAVSLGRGTWGPHRSEAGQLTDVAESPSVVWGAGTDGGPGGHDQVAGAPVQAGAAQTSWGEHSGARPWPQAGGGGGVSRPGSHPGAPPWWPWETPSQSAGSVTWPTPPGRALEYLCGGSPHSGSGPPRTRTAPRGPGVRGPSAHPAPGTRSGSRQSTSLGWGVRGHSEPLFAPVAGALPPRCPAYLYHSPGR